ncbi:hypothetical protein D9M70_566630 [compost metagenome]
MRIVATGTTDCLARLAHRLAGDGAGVDEDGVVQPRLLGFGPHHFGFVGIETAAEGYDLDAAQSARAPLPALSASSRCQVPVVGFSVPDHSHSAGPVMIT